MKQRTQDQPIRADATTAAEIDLHVGHRIRERRETLGITQNRLARHLGVTFSQVQKYEKGSNRIGAGRLYLTAAFLGVPVGHFYENAGNRREIAAAGGESVASGAELSTLTDAFLSIADAETRNSVLALVRSLAATGRLTDKPRQIVA